MYNDIIELKTVGQDDDFKVEYSFIPSYAIDFSEKSISRIAAEGIEELNSQYSICEQKANELNTEIDRLTNHADGLDYIVSVASGIIAGLIDSFFVGEFSFENAQAWGTEKVNKFVQKVAKSKGYQGDDLGGAIKHLEDLFPIAADKATPDFGGGLQHHLRDFSHHPTPIGLYFSILTQFTGKLYGTDVHGFFKVVNVSDLTYIGKDIPQKITFGVVYWIFHMVSDIAGSSGTIIAGGRGTGLPGPLVSLLKELSALPIFKKTNDNGHKTFSAWLSKLFNGTLLGKKNEAGKVIQPIQFDLRTEIGVAHELSKQAIPVLINECVVRGFYSIRRFIQEIKTKNITSISDLNRMEIKNILPFKNRTITRMLTISTGTFVAIDLGDAAIRSAIKSGGNAAVFAAHFVLHINFIGIGRFAVAGVTDIVMGIKRSIKRNERIEVYNRMLMCSSAKLLYRQTQVWTVLQNSADQEEQLWEALGTNEAEMVKLLTMLDMTTEELKHTIEDNLQSLERIGELIPNVEKHNPGLTEELLRQLRGI